MGTLTGMIVIMRAHSITASATMPIVFMSFAERRS
jgi:hypothetical protein